MSVNRTLGPYGGLMLLGGGRTLLLLAQWARSEGLAVSVVTSPRHLRTPGDDETLSTRLEQSGIDCVVVNSLTELAYRKATYRAKDFLSISLGAPWIFSEQHLLEHYPRGLLNLHGTPLPRYRGGGGFSWQVLTGNRFGAVALHAVNSGIDTGEVVFFHEFLYPQSCVLPIDYEDHFNDQVIKHLPKVLEKMVLGEYHFVPQSQPDHLSTYWPRLATELNGWIDWTWTGSEIARFACAFDVPYAGSSTHWNGLQVRLTRVSTNVEDGSFHPYQAGIIYRVGPSWICVAAVGQALIVERVTDARGVSVFARLRAGDRFWTPTHHVEESRKRVHFGPSGLLED